MASPHGSRARRPRAPRLAQCRDSMNSFESMIGPRRRLRRCAARGASDGSLKSGRFLATALGLSVAGRKKPRRSYRTSDPANGVPQDTCQGRLAHSCAVLRTPSVGTYRRAGGRVGALFPAYAGRPRAGCFPCQRRLLIRRCFLTFRSPSQALLGEYSLEVPAGARCHFGLAVKTSRIPGTNAGFRPNCPTAVESRSGNRRRTPTKNSRRWRATAPTRRTMQQRWNGRSGSLPQRCFLPHGSVRGLMPS